MELPKFLVADNSTVEETFILHTEYPRFLLNVHTDELEWFDPIEEEEDLNNQVKLVLEEAYVFFEEEVQAYEDQDEDEYGI